ncbi:hypothetical protein Lal_00018572 [Lupinus albus]|nr:hypothetical protein Lal_00018572 [Lupinus albus]
MIKKFTSTTLSHPMVQNASSVGVCHSHQCEYCLFRVHRLLQESSLKDGCMARRGYLIPAVLITHVPGWRRNVISVHIQSVEEALH